MIAKSRRIAGLLVAVFVFGCAMQPAPQSVNRAQLATMIRQHGVEPPAVVVPYRLTDEMKQWTHEHVARSSTTDAQRLLDLTTALFDPSHFDLEYDDRHTGTAAEVFETRQANCLAFTHLFVGMAREVGVAVFFLEVRDIESYKKEGDLIVVSDHVAVGWGELHDIQIIDFAAEAPDSGSYRRIRRIDDYRAIAMYYSNRGAEYLRNGNYESALEWLRAAVAIDPEYAASWINLGVALRRSNNLAGAEASYRRALEVDLSATSALQNLAALLQVQGRGEEALELIALSERTRTRNPFTYLTLADLSMRYGRMDEAGHFYRKAMRHRNEEADPLAALGLWELERGQRAKARRLLKRAESIEPNSPRISLLRRRLGMTS